MPDRLAVIASDTVESVRRIDVYFVVIEMFGMFHTHTVLL